MMKKFVSGFFLALSLYVLASGVAQAQLKNPILGGGSETRPFSAKSIFANVYQTDNADLNSTLPGAIGSVISMVLAFTGLVLLVIMVYAGVLWLTAGGNEDQVSKAKQLIKNAIIGMAIALSAFVLTNFIVSSLIGVLNQQGGSGKSGSTSVESGT